MNVCTKDDKGSHAARVESSFCSLALTNPSHPTTYVQTAVVPMMCCAFLLSRCESHPGHCF